MDGSSTVSQDRVLKPAEVAAILRCSVDQVRALCKSKKLRSFNISDKGTRQEFRINASAVEAFRQGEFPTIESHSKKRAVKSRLPSKLFLNHGSRAK
jgi:hypothetical protein